MCFVWLLCLALTRESTPLRCCRLFLKSVRERVQALLLLACVLFLPAGTAGDFAVYFCLFCVYLMTKLAHVSFNRINASRNVFTGAAGRTIASGASLFDGKSNQLTLITAEEIKANENLSKKLEQCKENMYTHAHAHNAHQLRSHEHFAFNTGGSHTLLHIRTHIHAHIKYFLAPHNTTTGA